MTDHRESIARPYTESQINPPRRYVAYYRVSTGRQGRFGFSVEGQRAAVNDYFFRPSVFAPSVRRRVCRGWVAFRRSWVVSRRVPSVLRLASCGGTRLGAPACRRSVRWCCWLMSARPSPFAGLRRPRGAARAGLLGRGARPAGAWAQARRRRSRPRASRLRRPASARLARPAAGRRDIPRVAREGWLYLAVVIDLSPGASSAGPSVGSQAGSRLCAGPSPAAPVAGLITTRTAAPTLPRTRRAGRHPDSMSGGTLDNAMVGRLRR